ncbi:type II toxin-antitoxin system RelE/ParE family toxin [Sphingomonas sp.]|uniref:type II toxin-antitoxin system RelE/ParE family toxin n=1 Tax=Sphingomonas sp. TaxID=28214 RepID=UPI0035BC7A28
MKVVWTPVAEADRHSIWMFLAEHSVVRADKVEARLRQRVNSLLGVPSQGHPVARGRRELSIPEIQLRVVYRIAEEENAIRILRVRSTRQNREGP